MGRTTREAMVRYDGRSGAVVFLALVASIAVADGGTGKAASSSPSPVIPLRAGAVDPHSYSNLLEGNPARGFAANQAYVAQLDGPITPDGRAALIRAGVELGPFLGANAYLADLSRASAESLAGLGFARWVGAYENGWKLDPGIGQRLSPFVSSERKSLEKAGRLRVVVTLFPGVDRHEALANVRSTGASVRHIARIGRHDVLIAEMPAADLEKLVSVQAVQFVEEAGEAVLRTFTSRWISQSNQDAWFSVNERGLTGAGQIAGIIDSRVDAGHCAFFDSEPIGPTHRKIEAYNASLGVDPHGTFVANVLVGDAGIDDNTRGIAYEGRLAFHVVPIFPETETYDRLSLHHSQGARVHNNSWGDDTTTAYNGLSRAIDQFMWDHEDDLVIFAVTNQTLLRNPENAKNLLAVAASRDTPNQHEHCRGGSGPTSDGRRKPEVMAPGCIVFAAQAGTACSTAAASPGTSFAAPAVSAAAMLVRQYYMEGFYPIGFANPSDGFVPSGALIKATLINSSVDMTGIADYPSDLEGWGRILLEDALFFAGDQRDLAVLDDVRNAFGLSTGQTAEYFITPASSGLPLKVTLVWTDPPAAAGASFAAVNDLNLQVEAPGGALYQGNVFSGGFSTAGGSADDRNNVEQVHIESPEAGTWTVRVLAAAVNESLQGYALVATGDLKRPCGAVDDCEDTDPCTVDDCPPETGFCENIRFIELYGDVTGNDLIDVDDILCAVRAFTTLADCPTADIAPCGGNGAMDVDDLLAVLQAFGGTKLCPDPCPPL